MEGIVLINEERGVAASRYDEVIDEMYQEVEQTVNTLLSNNKLTPGSDNSFYISKFITNKIDFVEENKLIIKINFEVHKKDENVYDLSNAVCLTSKFTKITQNGLLSQGNIEIDVKVNELGYIYKRTFYDNIYHELNHLYDLYSQLCSNNDNALSTKYSAYDVTRYRNKIKQYLEENLPKSDSSNIVIVYVEWILYQLLSDTEMNAKVAAVYGELKSMNSRRETFKDDIKKTNVYFICSNSEYVIEDFQYASDKQMKIVMDAFKMCGIKIGNTVESFKRNLIKIAKEKVKELKKRIGKAASLYYDNIEDSNNIIKEYSKKHFGTFILEGQIIHNDEPLCLKEIKRLQDILEEK